MHFLKSQPDTQLTTDADVDGEWTFSNKEFSPRADNSRFAWTMIKERKAVE